MLKKNDIVIYMVGIVLFFSLFSCIPTYKVKYQTPYYNKDIRDFESFGRDGFYYSKGRWSEDSDFFYVRFFHSNGMYVTYLIENSNVKNFEVKLREMIKENTSPDTWGAYIIEGDTLRVQTIPYNAKYNIFTLTPTHENIYSINNQALTYQYSFNLRKKRKGDRFVALNNSPLIFKRSDLQPNYVELGLNK